MPVTEQPDLRDWEDGLCDCTNDVKNCVLTAFCCPCMTCYEYELQDEGCAAPLFVPHPVLVLASHYRGKQDIEYNAHQLGHNTSGREDSAVPSPATPGSHLSLTPTSPSHSAHLTQLQQQQQQQQQQSNLPFLILRIAPLGSMKIRLHQLDR
ncbi:hypothetical protein SprV_0301368300 [Sparganum proliferum]